jgi:hypothetical protein
LAAGFAVAAAAEGGGTARTRSARPAPVPGDRSCLSAAEIDIDRVDVRRLRFIEIPLNGADTAASRRSTCCARAALDSALALGSLPTGTYHQIRLHIVDTARLQRRVADAVVQGPERDAERPQDQREPSFTIASARPPAADRLRPVEQASVTARATTRRATTSSPARTR